MSAILSARHAAKWQGTVNSHCPNCESVEVVLRTVNDLFRAVDPRGKIFEVTFQVPMWTCKTCKLCWQGQEALAAKEAAYQRAIVKRQPNRMTA